MDRVDTNEKFRQIEVYGNQKISAIFPEEKNAAPVILPKKPNGRITGASHVQRIDGGRICNSNTQLKIMCITMPHISRDCTSLPDSGRGFCKDTRERATQEDNNASKHVRNAFGPMTNGSWSKIGSSYSESARQVTSNPKKQIIQKLSNNVRATSECRCSNCKLALLETGMQKLQLFSGPLNIDINNCGILSGENRSTPCEKKHTVRLREGEKMVVYMCTGGGVTVHSPFHVKRLLSEREVFEKLPENFHIHNRIKLPASGSIVVVVLP
ncbi:MAG: hypothetical protein LBR91_03270 [Puniceicoccales bacterium]|jgi:hypothetical protein|nr:hypothetical protein [Puniceicoccales bacterium]